jgi:hypothetical protein
VQRSPSSPEQLRLEELVRMRWLRFAHRGAPVGRTVMLDGFLYRAKADGAWDRHDPALVHRAVSEDAFQTGMRASDVAARKRAAAPEWADLIGLFGEQGVVRNHRGKIVGYRYPKYDDPEKNQKVALQAYELWDRHRRVSVDAGAELNANIKLTTLENRDSGQVRQVDERYADGVATANDFTLKR